MLAPLSASWGAKVVISSQLNSLLHEERSHTAVSRDSTQHSVGSTFPPPPPLLNSNWKALLSPACLYQHGQGSRRLKPRLKTKELLQSNPQSSLVVVATSISAYLWHLGRSAHGITSGQSHSASNHPKAISCQVQHSNFEIKLQEWGCCLSPWATALLPEVTGYLPPTSRTSKRKSRGPQPAPTDLSNQVSANFSNDRMDFSQSVFSSSWNGCQFDLSVLISIYIMFCSEEVALFWQTRGKSNTLLKPRISDVNMKGKTN